jgi:hypothetical protein
MDRPIGSRCVAEVSDVVCAMTQQNGSSLGFAILACWDRDSEGAPRHMSTVPQEQFAHVNESFDPSVESTNCSSIAPAMALLSLAAHASSRQDYPEERLRLSRLRSQPFLGSSARSSSHVLSWSPGSLTHRTAGADARQRVPLRSPENRCEIRRSVRRMGGVIKVLLTCESGGPNGIRTRAAALKGRCPDLARRWGPTCQTWRLESTEYGT